MTPETAVESARDCAAAAGPEGVDIDILVERGWSLTRIEEEGEAVDTPVRVLGKSSRSPLIITSTMVGPAGKGCIIIGGLKKRKSFEELRGAFGKAFTVAGAKNGDGYFRIGSDIAILSQTGSRRKPAFRVAVTELGEKN
ncbi:hypothetical protein GRI94_12830 [Erythrobacter jejuensis]|uniref:Uncharacterized protein n=1 Tax=Parerythrobacter jejuensis TaxID=795812 RepID=A0A845ATM0_9SPHN|nr:hypothetical protein [Parerythrobacter jejuensis]